MPEKLKLREGDQCKVVAGTHAGKSGTVRDIITSKTGHITITVVQKSGERFKTLGRNVSVEAGPKAVKTVSPATAMPKDVQSYHKTLKGIDQTICDLLYSEISKGLPKAENKVWHKHPVWFQDGNPIVGYDKLKNCVRLLFWSGQSFEEEGLKNEGSFKAAEIRYTAPDQVNAKDLKRWLKKSLAIQWDYKNIVKRKGLLERLK
jgi:ribosomal protein L24